MQIKNMSQFVDSEQSETEPSFNANQLDSFRSALDDLYISEPPCSGWISAARASRAPTSPFDSSSALSSGSSSAPAVGASSSQFFGAPSKPAAHASSTPSFGVHSTPAFVALNDPSFRAQSAPASGASNTLSFGAPSTRTFGSSIPPSFGAQRAFGSSTSPSFGAQSTPAFGSSTSLSFGAQSTPAFGSSTSLSFGAQSTPAFGSSNSPSFGAQSTPAFGSSTSLSFGVQCTPAFGSSNSPSFGAQSTPAFGSSTSLSFGAQSTPALRAQSTPAFGVSRTPSFGAQSTPAFGASNSPSLCTWPGPVPRPSSSLFGTPSARASGTSNSHFGAPSTPASGFSSSPIFGVSTTPDQYGAPTNSVFGRSIPASNVNSTFGPPTVITPTEFVHSPFDRITPGGVGFASSCTRCSFPNGSSSQLPGDRFNLPPWGESACVSSFNSGYQTQGIQHARAVNPAQIFDEDGQKIQSISAMLAHKGIDMTHEELRWIDYRQRSDKGNCVSNSPWIKNTITNSKSGCGNVQPLPNSSNITKSNMISISINIEAPSGVATQLLDLLKSFHINVESSSTSPPTTDFVSSTPF